MNNEKYVEIYNELLNVEMDKILEVLQESFISYYGKENKSKIEQVFNELVIVYLDKNIDDDTLINKDKKSSNNYQETLNELLNKNLNITEQDLINYSLFTKVKQTSKLESFRQKCLECFYNKFLLSKKLNNSDLNINLGTNKGNINEIYDRYARCGMGPDEAGITYFFANEITIFIRLKNNG